MCGFAGFLNDYDDSAGNWMEDIVSRMAMAIQHRGPDDAGVWADRQSGIALGHRRLSVIDLSSAGHQPMHSSSGRFVMAFNGEIYNHNTLRTELAKIGSAPEWRGHSDTETLLAGFEAWGIKATLRRAVGMFAFALWDKKDGTLKLARDRFGEKPLYYGWTGKGARRAFVFGSELKALRAYPGFDNPVNRSALQLYFQFCTVPAPYSIYEDIHKLMPGAILTLRSEKDCVTRKAETETYWSLIDTVRIGLSNKILDEKEALSLLESTLREAVASQTVADVPLGAFLSGGVDSSAIVALMQTQSSRPVQTFTIGFDEAGFDESPYASAVARHLGTKHHEIRVSSDDTRSVIPLLPKLYDEPFADSSQIPSYLVCKAARSSVTVALSGDAGDELFGGYNRYLWGRQIWNRISFLPPSLRQLLGAGIQVFPVDTWDWLGQKLPDAFGTSRLGDKAYKLANRMKTVKSIDDLYRSLVTEWPQDINPVKCSFLLPSQLDNSSLIAGLSDTEHQMMLWDSITYLPDDILTKVDRAAMGVSLETRVPFLDHRLLELAWRLPLNMKIRAGVGKWALRQVLYNYVPRELIERPKAGFAIPVGQWLRGPLRNWAESLLEKERLEKEGYLNPYPILKIWREHLTGRYDWTNRLWVVLMFQAWLEENQ